MSDKPKDFTIEWWRRPDGTIADFKYEEHDPPKEPPNPVKWFHIPIKIGGEMSDIVERLRKHYEINDANEGASWHPEICDEAAAEIERARAIEKALRGTLRYIMVQAKAGNVGALKVIEANAEQALNNNYADVRAIIAALERK